MNQHEVVLDILVQGRRNAIEAKTVFERLLTGPNCKPKRIITNGLRSYGAAKHMSCTLHNTGPGDSSTIVPNTHTTRPDAESAKCNASRRLGRHSDSYQRTA